MERFRLYAATGDAVARVDVDNTTPDVEIALEGSGAQCVAVDPDDVGRVFVGTFNDGIYRTLDGGASWDAVGDAIPHKRVLSVAISPSHRVAGRSVVYAGTEPSALFRSEDNGRTWEELPGLLTVPSAPTWSFPPRPWTSHVRWIAPHHSDRDVLFVGIELGGVMRSLDAGETWEDRKPRSQPDSHVVLTHSVDGDRVYEAAGGGVAVSTDRGDSWRPVDDGMDRHYVWGLAVDPADPDLWYVSATYGPMQAHSRNGKADAVLYRRRGDAPWEALGEVDAYGSPLHSMPYALVTLRDRAGMLVAGFDDGRILMSDDAGESWLDLGVDLDGLVALSV